MPSNDVESYLDHAHLTAADFTAFEHLLAAQRDRRPYTPATSRAQSGPVPMPAPTPFRWDARHPAR